MSEPKRSAYRRRPRSRSISAMLIMTGVLLSANSADAQIWPFGSSAGSVTPKEQFLNELRAGDVAAVAKTVAEHPEWLNARLEGRTPLHWSVSNRHVDVARLLIKKGADPNLRGTQYDQLPLDGAATAEMVNLLIANGANPNGIKPTDSPLQRVLEYRYLGAAEALRAAGAKVDFELAVKLGDVALTKTLLKEKPWLAKLPNKPLLDAAELGNLELVELLLEHGADPDSLYGPVNNGRYTPLSSAVRNARFEMARVLLEAGASTAASAGKNHDQLFIYAIAHQPPRITQLLIDHGVNVEYGTLWNRSAAPLHVAAAIGGRELSTYGMFAEPSAQDRLAIAEAAEKVRMLLDAGARINPLTEEGATPLLFAALAGNQAVSDLLLERGAKLDIASACLLNHREFIDAWLAEQGAFDDDAFKSLPFKTSPVHWAAMRGDVKLLDHLLGKGLPADARAPQLHFTDDAGFQLESQRNSLGVTPLFLAARGGRAEVVDRLLREEIDVQAVCGERRYSVSPLYEACRLDRYAAARRLLQHGARIQSIGQWTYIVGSLRDEDLLNALLQTVQPSSLRGRTGADMLATAAHLNNEAAVKALLARGAKIDIFSAAILGRADEVRRLVKQFPTLINANQPGSFRQKPLELAIKHGRAEVVRVLLNNGATRPRANDPWNSSLVHQAVEHGHWELVECLLDFDFTLQDRDHGGETLAHAAASGCRPAILKRLIDRGLDPRVANFANANALHSLGGFTVPFDAQGAADLQRRAGETAKLLIAAGVDVNARDNQEETPLHQAAAMGFANVARQLLDAGAEINPRNIRNRTPLANTRDSTWNSLRNADQNEVRTLLKSRGATN